MTLGPTTDESRMTDAGDRADGPAVSVVLVTADGYAAAAFVAPAEDHCSPNPIWAEAMLHRHDEGYAVVGPAMRNANPSTYPSRADFAFGPGRSVEPT